MTPSTPHARTRRRAWRWGASALVVAAVVVVGFALRPEPPTRLLTASVRRGDLERTVVATGTVEARRLVSVGAQVSGQIRSLEVALGDRVVAGQTIARIDSTTQRNALRNAEASLANVRAQRAAQQASLAQAEAAFRRQRTMLESDATSRADFETARAAFEAAEAQLRAIDAQIEQSRTALDTARADLGYTQVAAPIDGTVVAIVTEEGQTVNAVQSSPTIVKIAQLDTVRVQAQISEADVIRVRPGQTAYFTILGAPERRFPATLRSIEPAPDTISEDDVPGAAGDGESRAVYYNGLFDVPNPDGVLRIDMTANVTIVLARIERALLVPLAALGARADDGTHAVRVLEEGGRVSTRKVRIGLSDQVDAQVLSGLREGARVVIGEAAEEDVASSFLPPPPPDRGR